MSDGETPEIRILQQFVRSIVAIAVGHDEIDRRVHLHRRQARRNGTGQELVVIVEEGEVGRRYELTADDHGGPDHPGAELGKQMSEIPNGDPVSGFENGNVGQQAPHRSR